MIAAIEVRPEVYTALASAILHQFFIPERRKFLQRNPIFGDNLGLTLIFQNRKKVPHPMPRAKEDEPNTHRTMHVVNHIRSLIENGTLQPGDKIPPEREFARTLKISRASLRTGIGYLAAMGVMKVRHGVGTFVADGPAEFGKASLA